MNDTKLFIIPDKYNLDIVVDYKFVISTFTRIIRLAVEDLQIELSRILGDKGDDSSGQPAEPKKKRRRRRTAAQKAKLSAALKASWAARKAKKK